MLEIIINLILTGLFLRFQADSQITVDNLADSQYHLSQEQVGELSRTAPQKKPDASLGVEVTAQSVLVVDKKTGKVLYQKNPTEIRSIASLTKLMTALVFLDNNPGWDKTVTIESSDYREGATDYFIAGEEISVRDLFYGTLVASANEGAAALARATGFSEDEFVQKMNSKAKSLGLSGTAFVDSTGLKDGNRSNAADVLLVLRAALAQPQIADATSANSYDIYIINKNITRRLANTNKILGQRFGLNDAQYQVEAGKTGYLEAAGYCLATQVKDDVNNKILVVVLGSQTLNDRFSDTKSLAYWVFNNYFWQ